MTNALPSPPASSFSGVRGHLILKSHRPLPRFICAIPVPPATASVETLRNTVVAILSGRVSADGDPSSGLAKGNEPMSYSEHLKQQTVHEWRCKSVLLELKQNAMIAPETREDIRVSNRADQDVPGSGFELTDEHECALLEHGDEVNVWLREGQTIESLRLPRLSSRHKFGLPNQPALSRSGMLLDSEHASPLQDMSDDADYGFGTHTPQLRRPTEPSSHSSSVQGNPNGQFETTLRHRPGGMGQRVVTVNSNGNVKGVGGEGVYRGAAADHGRQGTRSKPKRIMSEGARLYNESESNVTPGTNAAQRPERTYARAQSYGVLPMPPSGQTARQSEAPKQGNTSTSSPPLHSPSISNRDIILATQPPPSQGPSRAERQKSEKVRMAGQKGMPSQALIVGPGVQGKVGRMNSMDAANDNVVSTSPASGGNKEAFVAFTAAGSEFHQTRRPSDNVRRVSSKNGFFSIGDGDKTEQSRRPSATRAGGSGGRTSLVTAASKSKSTGKQYVKLPERPEIPPIRNLNPFEMADEHVEKLPPMPTPEVPPVAPRSYTPDLEQDAAIARALSEALNYESPPTSPTQAAPPELPIATSPGAQQQASLTIAETNGRQISNVVKAEGESLGSDSQARNANTGSDSPLSVPSAVAEGDDDDAEFLDARSDESPAPPAPAPPPMSKAERRYHEVQRLLEAERKRQADAEETRRASNMRAEDDKRKLLDKLEDERRRKLEKLRWQMWDEVRNRQQRDRSR